MRFLYLKQNVIYNMQLNLSIKTCNQNGKRLLGDSELLYDFEKYSSSYGLAKLAQEEFAKGFILKLVNSGALKWTKEVQRSLNHHISKQLVSVILNFLNPSIEEFLIMVENKTLLSRPRNVSDAINVYIHEVLNRWESSNWCWDEDPKYEKEIKFIFKGKEEKEKQDAFYIKISTDGKASDFSKKFNEKKVKDEIDKAKRFSYLLSEEAGDSRYEEIVEIIKLIKK